MSEGSMEDLLEEEFLSKISKESLPFWEGLKEGKFRIQRCLKCNNVVFYPRAICPKCGSTSLGWFDSTGIGTIYSYTVVHAKNLSGLFKHESPYPVILVQLDEGPLLMSNLVDYEQHQLRIGLKVVAVFEKVRKNLTIAKFKPFEN
jgi:uncharacterized OB-fold protein